MHFVKSTAVFIHKSKPRRVWQVAGILFVFIGLLALWYLLPTAKNKRFLKQSPAEVVSLKDQAVLPTLQAAPQVPALKARAPLPSREFLDAYNSGQNLRALVHKALQHPEWGGFFYAVKVLRQCAVQSFAEAKPLAGSGPDSNADPALALKQAQAADRLAMRCADFLPSEISNGRIDEIWKSGLARDPLIRATQDFLAVFEKALQSSGDAQARVGALQSILTIGDPMVLQDLGLRLALDVQDGKKGFIVDGKFYGLDSETDVGTAIYLLPCSQGLKCDAMEFDTLTRCASGLTCDADRFEYVRKMKESIPGAYDRVMAIYETMAPAVREANAHFFSRR